MTINIFLLKGDLKGENRSGAFLFLSGIFGLNQSYAADKVSCSRSQLSASGESRTSDLSISSLTLYH